jgi:hypothetical protein
VGLIVTWWEEIPAFVHAEPKIVPLADDYLARQKLAAYILAEAIEGWLDGFAA